jgi:TetR/AcrR family transcriptional regulator
LNWQLPPIPFRLHPDITSMTEATTGTTDTGTDDPAARKRPKPGERRLQILHALAEMLESPGGERVTTAGLAARLQVSEAALYRHFASKAQMLEGLIDFIESSVFGLVNQIVTSEASSGANGPRQVLQIMKMVAQFAEKNPGMARVMVGDALVFENDRLQQRMNQFFDKIEAALRQSMRDSVAGSATPTAEAQVAASLAAGFLMGRLQRFVRSGFRKLPSESLEACVLRIL